MLTVGLALLLQPTVGAAFVLGLLVGVLKRPRLATLEVVFPLSVGLDLGWKRVRDSRLPVGASPAIDG